jgi:hypothetical protein
VEGISILKKENREDWDEEENPDFLSGFGNAKADTLGEMYEVFAVDRQKVLDAVPGRIAPTVLFADACDELGDLIGDLARASFIHQPGQRFSEAGGLAADPWAGEKNKQAESEEQQDVNDGDGTPASAYEFLESYDPGIDEVGEEDRKQKEDEGSAGRIQKSKPKREQERCD